MNCNLGKCWVLSPLGHCRQHKPVSSLDTDTKSSFLKCCLLLVLSALVAADNGDPHPLRLVGLSTGGQRQLAANVDWDILIKPFKLLDWSCPFSSAVLCSTYVP
jgi:hypothetical protein